MIEIETPEIRVGKNDSGEYAEIVIPEEFNPGSIMVFATDMDVRLLLLLLLLLSIPLFRLLVPFDRNYPYLTSMSTPHPPSRTGDHVS